MSRRSLTALVAGALGVLALAAGALWLGPTQLGGPASYALVVGNSMEPLLSSGDLAVVRERRSYEAGDVVLYESAELGAKVLHRVLRVEGERYVFKGDNNDFVDAERVPDERMLGELTLVVPGAGAFAAWLRTPAHAALVVGLTTLFALSGAAGLGVLLRRGRMPRPRVARRRTAGRPWPQHVLLLLGGAGALVVVLAAVAFAHAETRVETVAAAHVQHGELAYRARVPRSPVYPDGLVSTGEPIFPTLVPRLHIAFDYRLDAARSVDAHGGIRLGIRLTDGRGWERLLPLSPERRFDGVRTTVEGTLDIARIEALIEQVRLLTGSGTTAYSLAVVPHVWIEGTSRGRRIRETFEPQIAFEVDGERLRPAQPKGAADALVVSSGGASGRRVAAELALGPLAMSVANARRASVPAVLLVLAAAAAAAAGARRREGEAARIARRYGHLLVAASAAGSRWSRATELEDIESLARIAAHHGRLILHCLEDDVHVYAVEEGPNVYVYRAAAATAQAEEPATSAAAPHRARRIGSSALRRHRLRPAGSRR